MEKPKVLAVKLATPTDRFRTVLHDVFGGSQTLMAKGLGCSQPMISRVAAGEKEPGSRLLMALASFPGISRRWALTGRGEPLSSLGPEPVAGDAMLPIARKLVPGQLEAYREYLSDACLPVLRRDYSPSRYWFLVNNDDQAERGLLRGDAILVQADGAWLGNPLLLRGKWCVVLPHTDGEPRLRQIADDEYPEIVAVDSPLASIFPASIRRQSMGFVRFRACRRNLIRNTRGMRASAELVGATLRRSRRASAIAATYRPRPASALRRTQWPGATGAKQPKRRCIRTWLSASWS